MAATVAAEDRGGRLVQRDPAIVKLR